MKATNSILLSLILLFLSACAATSTVKSNNRFSFDAYNWKMIEILNGSKDVGQNIAGIPLKKYQLTFKNNRFNLSGGCNQIGGNNQYGKDSIHFSSISATKRACQPNLMQADHELANILKSITNYRLEAYNTLILQSSKPGQSLILRGIPTSETKYGSKGIRKFIQIRNTTQESGLIWREAKYNAKYIQTNRNTPWHSSPFPGIEGFNPLPNQKYTVRIKEFYDAKSGQKVWVKDRVVMQGIIRR